MKSTANFKTTYYTNLLTCTNCGIHYVGENTTPFNLRMNIHRRGKSKCCKNATFSIQVIEKFPRNGYENGIKDNAMLKYRLQREDYWMKTLRNVYPFELNERTKFMNEDSLIGRLFP